MESWLDVQAWREIGVRALSDVAAILAKFVPSLLGSLAILAVGWLVARSVEVAARRVLHTLGVDRASARIGMSDALSRGGLDVTLSGLIARLLFWMLLLTFALSSLEAIGLEGVTATIDGLVAFIPRVIGACLILVLGLLFARFVSDLAASAFGAAGFASGARVGLIVRAVIGTLIGLVAVDQIGVDTRILAGPLTVVAGAAALSAGLCFALGARPIVTHILAGHFVRQSLPADAFVQIGERRGVVQRVGATDTLLRDGEVSWSVPNAQILEQVVMR